MNRRALEHLIRAAANIADDDEIIIFGSQSVLGQFPDAPAALCVSEEADLFPKNHPERWDLIDGSIGEGSPFHETFGYYAQGIEEGTATLPAGWRERLVPVRNENTRQATGLCLENHDVTVAKYVAGHDKGRRFIRDAAKYRLIDKTTVLARLAETPVSEERRLQIRDAIALDFNFAGRS